MRKYICDFLTATCPDPERDGVITHELDQVTDFNIMVAYFLIKSNPGIATLFIWIVLGADYSYMNN